MIKQEISIFKRVNTFGFATCKVEYNHLAKVEKIICIECNDFFASILSSTPIELIDKSITLPNYDIIGFLNNEILLNNVLYTIDKEHYKIEIIKDTETPFSINILLANITKQIEYHNVQNIANSAINNSNAQEESFLNLINNSKEPMLLFSGGEFLFCNKAAVDFLGYDSAEDLMNVSPINLSPEFQPNGMLSADLSPIINAEAIGTGYSRFEWVHLKKDKTEILVEVSLTYMVLKNQPVLHCVWRDLSKTKKLEEEILQQQQKTLNQLSIPITEIFKDILLLPLLGSISETRANNILQKVLKKIGETQSKILILDIAGIDDMNITATTHLIKLSKATHLMGCTTILSGVSGIVAEILVELGANIQDINSAGTLENALHMGFELLGIDVKFNNKLN